MSAENSERLAQYAEVLGCFFTDPNWKSCWEAVKVDLSSTDVGYQVVRAYLSRQHYEDVENSSPMVALPTDVARSGPRAKGAFETVFRAMVSVWERSMIGYNDDARRLRAQGIAAMCIGGMIVARTIVDRALAGELRASCMAIAHDLAVGSYIRTLILRNFLAVAERLVAPSGLRNTRALASRFLRVIFANEGT